MIALRIERLADDIVESLNEHMETAENEIQVSALAFKNEVKTLEQSVQNVARNHDLQRLHKDTSSDFDNLKSEMRREITKMTNLAAVDHLETHRNKLT